MLVVCTANVSRSPLAAALLRNRLVDAPHVVVDSAGLKQVRVGVDERAVDAGRALGVDISEHRPHTVTREQIALADLVIGMTRAHVRELVLVDGGSFDKTFTLKELSRRSQAQRDPIAARPERWRVALEHGRSKGDLMGEDARDDIADPYGRSPSEHQQVAEELANHVSLVVNELLRLVAPSQYQNPHAAIPPSTPAR